VLTSQSGWGWVSWQGGKDDPRASRANELSVSQGGGGGGDDDDDDDDDDDGAASFGGRLGDWFLAAALLVVREAVCELENPAPSGVAGSGPRGVVGFSLSASPDSRPPPIGNRDRRCAAVASPAPILSNARRRRRRRR
jgi:hypothetical protein